METARVVAFGTFVSGRKWGVYGRQTFKPHCAKRVQCPKSHDQSLQATSEPGRKNHIPDPRQTVETSDAAIDHPLTREEDDELRRLNYMAQHGELSERSKERMVELRLRDRRQEIRPTREL